MDQVLKIKKIPNRQQNANILSTITFAYTLPTFIKGFRQKTINEEDIPEIMDTHKGSELGDELEKYWNYQKSKSKPSLWLAFGRTFGFEFIVSGFVVLFDQLGLRLARVVSIIQLVKHFSSDADYEITLNGAYMYGGFIVATSLLSVFVTQLLRQYMQLLGMKMQVACSSLIYRKSLKLSKSVLDDVSVGHITNLISNDLSRIDYALSTAHYFWVCLFEIIAISVILCQSIGVISITGIVFMIMWYPVLVLVSKLCANFRHKVMVKTDERVKLMNEIIAGIQVIKMYTWEEPYVKLVDRVRRSETSRILRYGYLKGILRCAVVLPKIAIFITILTYVLTGNRVTAIFVFAIGNFYENLRQSLISNCLYGVSMLSEVHVAMERIKKFLLLEEMHKPTAHKRENGVSLKQVTARWSKDVPSLTLNKVTLETHENQLIGIVGPVGSGKSSILQVILNELPIESGSVEISGKISYASQEPWVFSGNIQQNILFGQPMNLQRYRDVLSVCALEQDLALFPYGDQTLVGERGITLSGGQKARISLARSIYRDSDVYLLDDPFSAVDINVGKHVFHECVKKYLGNKCVILITHQLQFLNNFHCIYLLENGAITIRGTYNELSAYESKFSNRLANVEKFETQTSRKSIDQVSVTWEKQKLPEALKEQRYTGDLSSDVYISYLRAGGSMLMLICTVATFVFSHASLISADIFVANWVNIEQNADVDIDRTQYIYVYSGIVILIILLVTSRMLIAYKFATQISINLHNSMFKGVVGTCMRFFHTNYTGRILNRFSKDMAIIDDAIPFAMMEFINCIIGTMGACIAICISDAWLVIPTLGVVVLFYLIRLIYMVTSQNLTRIEGTARSPIYGHLNETLQGLTTVRAFNAETALQKEFDKHRDYHSSVWSLYVACARTFGFYVDLTSVIYIAAIIIATLLNQTEEYVGNVGLAITQGISLVGVLQFGLLQSTDLQNQMTSVERVKEYTELEPEDHCETCQLPSDWPATGKIRIESLSLRYSHDQPYVLKNISLVINAKQKIGIVGRTGAGKSSLITALFQLAKTEGAIYIDDVNITKISQKSVRSKISIIPQDPLLFSGTVRRNLDPFNLYPDSDLWYALDQVQLKQSVSKLPLGLEHIVSDNGSNFSVGQRQLLCLARAIIRKNNILVLDEATANVDLQSDLIIQNTIRDKFAECTVLTIAHRLNTIMDSDKVLVIDAGEIVEYDHPHLLLQNKNGKFYSMLQKTGNNTSSMLAAIAEDSFRHRTPRLS